jgi:septal ring factor EnvC (AmiA/AmiB activator)
MASNGATISQASKMTLPLVILLITAILACSGYVYQQAMAQQVHSCNADIHHSTSDLDSTYARKDLVQQQYSEITHRLDHIDSKLDKAH